jgi:hypothetical protein
MKKSKYQVIKAMLTLSRKLGILLDKTDERVSFIIQSHEFFVWKEESDFFEFIEDNLKRLQAESKESYSLKK